MSSLVVGALQPSLSGTAILAILFLTVRYKLRHLSKWTLAALLLLFLNRNNLPLRWHLKVFLIGLRARLRWDLANWGWRAATPEQKKLGLKGGDLALGGIGKNPFDVISVRRSRVSFGDADYNL